MLKYSKITVCAALAKCKFYPLQVWYVMIHVIKDDIDPNSNINYCRKIPPVSNSGQLHSGQPQPHWRLAKYL